MSTIGGRTFFLAGRTQSKRGSVMIELAIVVPILIIFAVSILDFSIALNDRAGASLAARDLARIGVGYNYTSGESSCSLVCSRATQTLCSYGLDPTRYHLSTQLLDRVTDLPCVMSGLPPLPTDSCSIFSVSVERQGGLLFSSDPVRASFLLEDIAMDNWDPTDCGDCNLSTCPVGVPLEGY